MLCMRRAERKRVGLTLADRKENVCVASNDTLFRRAGLTMLRKDVCLCRDETCLMLASFVREEVLSFKNVSRFLSRNKQTR